ncbi:MAG: hypothetical protein ACP5US_04955 [Candidatus Kryptoniota bacterium]
MDELIYKDPDPYIQMSLEDIPANIKAGQVFTVSVRVRPQPGISLSAMPPIRIRSISPQFKVIEVELQVVDVKLNIDEPIRVVVQDVEGKQGKQKVQLEVQLSYCSDEEKWCRIGKKILDAELEVSNE